MEAFEEDNLLIETNEVKGEEVGVIDILSKIYSLEKSQGDILTMLQSMNNHLHVLTTNPLDSACKQV